MINYFFMGTGKDPRRITQMKVSLVGNKLGQRIKNQLISSNELENDIFVG
jgi:hypothetical protein